MNFHRSFGFLLAVVTLVCVGIAGARADGAASGLTADIYAAAKPKLIQVKTMLRAANRQSSAGSGFLVDAAGMAVTNYHVVSSSALEPESYRLEYATPDGKQGTATLIAIDLAHDLAVVRLDGVQANAFFDLGDDKIRQDLPKGTPLHAMGNPLELGFTVIDGTYSGFVDRSYVQRMHFSGALNPGMSGGPTVTDAGKVAGVNVAKQYGGELVSFLVPVHFAAQLLERAKATGPAKDFRAEIARQTIAREADLFQAFDRAGYRAARFGPYRAPESKAPWFTCWGQTNLEQRPRPRATVYTSYCNSDSDVFIAHDLSSGHINVGQALVRNVDLNAFQFARFLSETGRTQIYGMHSPKWFTGVRCRNDYVRADPEGPPVQVSWCARAYRDLGDLFDVWITAITQDRSDQALISRLAMRGIDYATAETIGKRFIEQIKSNK